MTLKTSQIVPLNIQMCINKYSKNCDSSQQHKPIHQIPVLVFERSFPVDRRQSCENLFRLLDLEADQRNKDAPRCVPRLFFSQRGANRSIWADLITQCETCRIWIQPRPKPTPIITNTQPPAWAFLLTSSVQGDSISDTKWH